MRTPERASEQRERLEARAVRRARDGQLRAELHAARPRGAVLLVARVEQPDLRRDPEIVGRGVIERERSGVRALDGVRAVDVELEVVLPVPVEAVPEVPELEAPVVPEVLDPLEEPLEVGHPVEPEDPEDASSLESIGGVKPQLAAMTSTKGATRDMSTS